MLSELHLDVVVMLVLRLGGWLVLTAGAGCLLAFWRFRWIGLVGAGAGLGAFVLGSEPHEFGPHITAPNAMTLAVFLVALGMGFGLGTGIRKWQRRSTPVKESRGG